MKRQYRVRWQRLGHTGKTQKLYMSEALAQRWALVVQGRIAEAFPDRDPDGCECGGNHSPGGWHSAEGCGGMATNAESWAAQSARTPPLTWGPVIDSREVGEWENAEVLAEHEQDEELLRRYADGGYVWPIPEPVAAGQPRRDDIPW